MSLFQEQGDQICVEKDNVRYSKLSEEEAAEQFEKRKSMLLQGLIKQHQQTLSHKKTLQEKPPRHTTSKPTIKQTQMSQTSQSQNEFIVFNKSQNKLNEKLSVSQQNFSPLVKNQFLPRQTNQNQDSQLDLYGMQPQVSYDTAKQEESKPSKRKKNQPQIQLGNDESVQKIKSKQNLVKTHSQVWSNYESAQSQSDDANQNNEKIDLFPPSQTKISLIEDQTNQAKHKFSKEKLLGQIGSLEIEIKRLMNEQETEVFQKTDSKQDTLQSNSVQQERLNKSALGPYFEGRKRNPSQIQYPQSSLSQSAIRSSKVDFHNKQDQNSNGYSLLSQKRITQSSAKRSQSPANSQQQPQNQNKQENSSYKKNNSQRRQNDSNSEIVNPRAERQLNLTLQFQRPFEQTKTLLNFKEKGQIQQFMKSVTPKNQIQGVQKRPDSKKEKTICTERKENTPRVNQARSNSQQKTKDQNVIPDYFLKSLLPFDETYKKERNSQKKNFNMQKYHKAPTPEPETKEKLSNTFNNTITLGSASDTHSTKDLTPQMLNRKQTSFIDFNKQKNVDAQIDEAVKLYNNLKQLINCKSGGALQAYEKPQKKLTTLDYFESRVKESCSQSKQSFNEKQLNDLPLKPKNLFPPNLNQACKTLKLFENRQRTQGQDILKNNPEPLFDDRS